jgi:RNA 2',3'-cyclic 3'-phosphodiesterase
MDVTAEPNLRLFTGIGLSREVVDNLEEMLRALRPLANLNWTPPENLHITLKFIGAWPEGRVGELTAALRGVDAPTAFDIEIRGAALFPNPRRARFIFAGAHSGPELRELHRRIEAALAPLGCEPEDRAFTPHLTLGRIRNENIGELKKRIQPRSDIRFGTFRAAEFHLFRSVTSPRGSLYSRLASFPLGCGA